MEKTILETVHETVKGLHDAGLVETQTMREFDAMCLTPIKEFTPKQIQRLRLRERVSQPVFAVYLNITSSTVKKWETGEKHPRGISLKLLNLIYRYGLEAIA